MTTSTIQGVVVRHGETSGRPFVSIDIPAELWTGNDGIEHPNNQRHFDGSLIINGVPLHLQAIQVERDAAGIQNANAAEYQSDLDSLSQLNGECGPFASSESVESGQEFVVYAVPYEE